MDSHEKQSPQRFGRYAAILIMLLTLGVGQMWADITYSGGYIYFDNSLGINSTTLQICARQSSWTGVSSLSNISNTKLYYVANPQGSGWGGILGWVVISANPAKSNSNFDNWSSYTWCSDWNTYGFNSGSTYLIVPSSTSKSQSVTTSYYSGGYSGLNSTQTINTVVKVGSGSYSSANSKAEITITSYALTGNGSVTKQSTSISTSAKTQTVSAARTATTTLEVGTVASGYQFDGWYTAATGGTQLSSSTTYTYYPTAATTVYARFSEKMSTVTLTASPSGKGSFTIGGAAATSTTAGVTTTRSVTAVPISGYHFVSWSITGGASISSTTTNPTTVTGGGAGTAATLTATFEADDVYTLTVAAGTGISAVTGTTNNIKAGNNIAITATVATGYTWSTWTKTGAGTLSTFTAGTKNQTVTVGTAGDMTLTASATETMRTITINGGTAASTTAGVATTGSATAAAPAAGKKFTGWTLGDGVTLSGGALTDRTINFTATANSSVTANYADRASVKLYFPKPSGWSKVHAYAWKESGTANGDWPGVEMTSYETVGCVNYYYYLYYTEADGIGGAATGSSTWDQVIFSNNGATQTNDLAISNGHYYYKADAAASSGRAAALASAWLVKGDFNSWGETDALTPNCGANSATKTISLTTGDKPFKINNIVEDKWWRITADNITATLAATAMNNNDGNMTLKPTIAGNYTFTVGSTNSTPTLAVTYPTAYQLNYSIGTVAGTSGSISSDPTTATGSYVASGNTVTLTAPSEKTGYSWKGWYGANDGSGDQLCATKAYAITMNSAKTVYACYTENQYNVAVSAGAGGSVSPTGTVAVKQVNGTSLTATPSAGYSFNNWTISGGGITPTTSSTSPQTFKATTTGGSIQANFSEIMRTVTVDVNNSYLGSVSTTSLTSVGPVTKSAEVTATAETGASFSSWTLPSGVTAAAGYTTSSNPIKINATAASKTITANFTETTYAVTLTTADASKGTVGSSSSAGQITAVTITATPKSGYMFSKWVKTGGAGTVTYYTGPGNGQVTDASGEEKETTYICVTGAVTLQATWEPDRSSGYVVYYGNDGKNADGGTDASQTRAWKDGRLYRPTTEEGNISSFTFTAGVGDVDKVIEFKIHKKTSPEAWYGYNSASGGKITGNISNVTLNTSYGNGRLCITMPGSYIFTWNKSNNQLSISYPTDVYYVRGGFDSWGWSHPMTETSSGVYSATVNMTEANHTYSGDNGFKLLIAGQYYGKNSTTVTRSTSTGSAAISSCSTSGANIGITTDYTGNYTFTYTVATNTLQVTYPTAYKVTYGKGTVDGSASNCSAVDIDNGDASVTSNSTWVKSGNRVVLTAPAAKSGYTYDGWFDNNSGSGEAITTNANCTITVSSALTRYACYHANTYTVSFDKNGGSGATPDAITVTYDAPYGALPAGPTPPGAGQFAGWFTASSGGTLVTAETIVSTASNHTLYAQYEDVYSVNVDFKCGGGKIYPSTVVNASPTALRPTIIAPAIFGYSFTGWTGSNVEFADTSNDTTTITATAATTVTANYAEVPTVYFKNNLEWDSVFVTFNCGWSGSVPTSSGKPYYAMTQIGTTDIYYCEIPSTYTASDYAGWAWNIAFDNKGFGDYKSTHTGSSTGFNSGEFTGRGDFDPKATLFIPYNGDTEARNGGTFYKTGCWMKYNSTESGYQLNMNEWVTGEHDDLATPNLTAPTAGGYEFSATVNLSNADYSYGFKLYKQYQKNTTDLWYTNTGTINASTESLPWHFWAGSTITETSQRCELHTEAVGDYKISVSFATGRPMVNVEYPTQVGDWRLAYNDRIAWSGDAHAADWYIYSRVIKAKADAEDLVSFYVSKAVGANAHIELQKCTAINPSTGAETWTKQGENLDLSSITGTGIYNFKVTQNGSKVATAAYDGTYEGNFYIRTDASDGGWTNYISSGKNVMTYSEYAKDYSGFTHYYMRFVEAGTNIKFCIANDYSPCLTEYCIDDDYTGEYIEAKGNVRYMWDHRTNKVSRAYISGSSVVSDRFLVLEGNTMIMAEDGTPLAIAGLNANEKNFADDQNWIYEATIKAKPTARVKLTAKFNNQVQYFKGSEGAFAEGTTVQLIGGTGDDAYKIRVIYDFKTNRLVGAWLPDDETVISSDWPIDADIMVLRYHQEGAKQIKFSGSGALSDVKTVYGAMQFNKYRVNNKRETSPHANLGLSNYERDLYWISFPFEVKLSDVFGFGTYGKHWIIEYYDGKTRAANGFWADSDPNWKFVTPSMRNNGYVLEANQGYVLALDLDNMTEESDVWAYGTENVYLYFPSTAHVSDIDAMDSKTISIDQTGYECTINRGTPDGDRRVKDSYWHVLGVPSYANASHETANAWTGTVPNIDPDNWTSSAPYIYEWVPSTNKYTVHSSSSMTFLPMHSYYAQYAQTTITWTNINATPAALVARRNAARKSNYEFRMEMTLGDEVADQTYVSLRDDEAVTNEFDFSYDLSKITNGSFAKTNCIYTLIGYERAAANCLPLETEATTIVPVGVNIATAGEYTIAIPSGTSGVGVTLVDNETGLRTNLALEDYTVALEAGTQDDRFYLEISPIKHVATDIENVQNDETQNAKARKVIIDQKMYIIKDGRVFDAQGARVK